MVKKVFSYKLFPGLIFFYCIGVQNVAAQTDVVVPKDTVTSVVEAGIDDLPVSRFSMPALQEVGGSPFFNPEYKLATVQLKNDIAVANIPVKFNVYNNVMMVKKDGVDMKLETFQTVSYNETGRDGSEHNVVFAKGFPEVEKHNESSIYQILSDGPKIQLLKYLFQKVEDAATLGDYSRREIVTTEQLYIYKKSGEIKSIKATKKDLLEALPEMAAKIDEIAKANNLKLKSISDVTLVIEALNKP